MSKKLKTPAKGAFEKLNAVVKTDVIVHPEAIIPPKAAAPKATATSTGAKAEASELTADELDTLKECEEKIDRGNTVFSECSAAIHIIKSQKLFRGQYESFDEYCRQRWDYDVKHGYRLAKAGALKQLMGALGDSIKNENQARAFDKVPKDKVIDVMELAKDYAADKPIETKNIRQAIGDLLPDLTQSKPKTGTPKESAILQMPQNCKSMQELLEEADWVLNRLPEDQEEGSIRQKQQVIVAELTKLSDWEFEMDKRIKEAA